MDQGDLAREGVEVAPARGRFLTPLRAALLVMGAVLGGVALSLMLGSSPAQAAGLGDGNGSGTDQGPLGSATSIVTSTVTSTINQTIPSVQRTVHARGESLVTAAPATRPLVTPVVATIRTTLTLLHQLTIPAVESVLPFAQHTMATPNWAPAPFASVQLVPGAPTGLVAGALPTARSGAGAGPLPDPILTSGSGVPAAALGVLSALFTLVLLVARRRLRDDALPASPTFETDTSPA